MLLVLVIEVLVPHEYVAEKAESEDAKLMRTGVLTALGIAIHNFP